MATKKIILDFKQQADINTIFKYTIYINGVLLSYGGGLNKIDLKYRIGGDSNPYEIGIGTDLSDTIDRTLAFLIGQYHFSGFVAGYATSIAYARVGNTIEITITSATALDQSITVWEIVSSDTFILIRPEDPCVTAYISNQTVQAWEEINALPTNFYYIKNNTLNTQVSTFIPSNLDTRLIRGYNYSILKGSDLSVQATFDIPSGITAANMNMYFSNNDLYVNVTGASPILSFRYSLDGITYQDSPIFTALAVGDYTVYIQDSYGCVKTFTISNTGTVNANNAAPYDYISESNSIRFVKRVDWGNCGNYKNRFNTLSCEENVQIANKFVQLFQTCDIIKTQVKTSYDNLEIYTIDNNNVQTEIIANKIINNIGIQDKRDCTYYTYAGQLAVFFTTGNLYTYNTSTVTGTYALNGSLPEYSVQGTWIETPYGTLQIQNIILGDDGTRSILFNAAVSLPAPVAGTIQTIYNRESFNIWEFDIDMSAYTNTNFTVGIRFYQTVEDASFPDKFWLSEKINVKDRHPNSIEVVWFNSKNTDIYFYSGIRMKNRLNLAHINTLISEGDIEIQRTDSQVIPIDATNYNALEFSASFLTTGIAVKILLALKHDNLFIENVPYVLAENPDLAGGKQNNFYSIKAKLLEAGDVFNQGTANTQVIYSGVALVGLLQGDPDQTYIRIQ